MTVPQFVDTHCHMNMMVDKKFDAPLTDKHLEHIASIVCTAAELGVGKIINVGTSLGETQNSIAVAQKYENVWASAGIHPCDCADAWFVDFKLIRDLVGRAGLNKIVAVGETGLDFFHKPFFKQRQVDAFKAHIELSIEHQLPLVIHTRESADEVLRVLDDYHADITGVLHCFLQEQYVADKALEWDLLLGIDGPISYPKNQWLRDMVAELPLEHLIFETDSPFLPPQHLRGKQNSPATIPSFAQIVADVKGVSLDDVARVTSENVTRVFGI